nr:hypothetical protein [Tanacetum cinerariifolium]
MPEELKNSAATLQRMMKKVLADQKGRNMEIHLQEVVIKIKSEHNLIQDVKETLRKLKRVNIKVDPIMFSFEVKEGKFLGHMVTEEGLRAYPKRIQAIILSPTPRSPNQIRSLFLQLIAISKFILKLAKLKHPIREDQTRMETTKESGWTNEAEEALRRIKRKLGKLSTLAIPKEEETLMLCLRQRKEIISSVLLIGGGNPDTCFLGESTTTRNEDMLHPNEKKVQALIHTTRSLRTIFRKHKVKVVIDGQMEEILKLSEKQGRLAKWAAKVRTFSYIPRKEAEGSIMKKFFGQEEQVERTPDANEEGTLTLSKKLQAKSTSTPRAWQLYLGKETIKEGSGVGIILVSPEEMMHSYAISLKFNASNHVMDYEPLLAGLAASTNQSMKDLHVFIDLLTLVAQVSNHTPPKNSEPKSRSVNRIGNYKADIPQLGSIVVHEKPQKTIIKIKEMRNEVSVNGAAVTIPMEAVESVNARFVNTLYGYFIGDRGHGECAGEWPMVDPSCAFIVE